MRVIENKIYEDVEVVWHNSNLSLEQSDCEIVIDKQCAKQLIEVLKEFVEE